jgi:P-type Ca2+ transporter type 2C
MNVEHHKEKSSLSNLASAASGDADANSDITWHVASIEGILSRTNSSLHGLTLREAKDRLKQHGPNQLTEKNKQPAWVLFLSQFKDFMILVLVGAAIISGVIGESIDTIVILFIVLLNAIVGFVQEYRAEKAMEALKKMSAPQSTVLRDGKVVTVESIQLVPGDIVLLEAGNTIPADLRLFEVQALKLVESSLTGESLPVDKINSVLDDKDVPLGDRLNMAYKGTQVSNGRGKGIVVATGMETEIGQIAEMLHGKKSITPLQQRMIDFGKKLSYLILVICAILFVVGLLRGEEPLQMFLISISLAVAAIPEALPALITVALSRGAKKLINQNVLIRKLSAVETLGAVSFICTDKTGTLTQNKMKVVTVEPSSGNLESIKDVELLPLSMILNQNVIKEKDQLIGDPTEIALVEYFNETYSHGLFEKLQNKFPREEELPFDSDRKCMTTIHRYDSRYLVVSKGAVEFISTHLQNGNEQQILKSAEEMATKGIRVLAFAYKIIDAIPKPLKYEEIESNLSFVGLVGMIDPPREEAKNAIAECKAAGIKPVMITGDHKETAAAIARQIGITGEQEVVISGTELNNLSADDFNDQVEKIRVYARVSPRQKLNIVEALQNKNHFVAMTGDGVNDAPSLKKANIGVAMGITGTDVSKEAADMILLDDNFATIVKAVGEGRRIYDNIRRFVKYIMTCNGAEIWTIFLAPLLGLPMPLLPIHILWINLVTDGLPGLALSAEKAEHNIMQRPPRKSSESLFAEGIGLHIVWVGLFMAFLTLGIQAWAIHNENAHWQTMVFTVLSMAQLAHAFAIRSDYQLIYKKGFFTNPLLLCAVLFVLVLQLGVIYLPFANEIFKTQPLSLFELGICMGATVVLFHAVEVEKWIKQSRKAKSNH